MTTKQAIEAAVAGIPNVSSNSIDKAIIDAGLSGAEVYSIAYLDTVNAAAVMVLSGLLVSSISEGGYSISIDRKAVEARIAKLGDVGGVPEVRMIGDLW